MKDNKRRPGMDRRQFLTGVGAAALGLSANKAAGLSLSGATCPTLDATSVSDLSVPQEQMVQLPEPTDSGIEHVIVVMMENRSFDHFLGWLPHAHGKQQGLTYVDRNGQSHPTFHLQEYQTCNYQDPDHSYEGGRIQYDKGACDGWLRAGSTDLLPIGYYNQNDLAFLGQAAPAWTTCDNYFAAIMAETYPNRIYMHAGQTDRIHNSTTISTLPTIWDRLADAGVSGRYYYSDIPFLALWGTRHMGISRPYATFLADCAAGTLPSVSYVDPRFGGEGQGVSNDDHPTSDIRNGEALLAQIYNAVIASPHWRNTVLVINFDEWGGFYDHVAPPVGPIPEADQRAGNQDGLLGFRVPCLVISPFARRGYVSHRPYDHTSILKMIEWRWNLPNLSVRDANANNLAKVLNLHNPDTSAAPISVPVGPYGGVCEPATPAGFSDLAGLAGAVGFPVL